MRRAVALQCAGAVLAVAGGIVGGLTTKNVIFYTSSSTSATTTVHTGSSVVVGAIGGVISGGLWLWMAWKTGTGRNWARVLSSVLFAVLCLRLIADVVALARAQSSAAAFTVDLIEWGAGLAAIVLLWRAESGEFIRLARQARLAGGYDGASAGYQPPGYGQPPQPGPPAHNGRRGQPPQYPQQDYRQQGYRQPPD
jgi:hypothetical protein